MTSVFNKQFAFLALLFLARVTFAQDTKSQQGISYSGEPKTDVNVASAQPVDFARNLVRDEKAIWTSPFKARIEDLNWLVPVAGITAGLINADAELSSHISTTNTFGRHSSTLSDAGLAATLAGAGGLYLFGQLHGDEHQRETGILTLEAMTNSLMVVEGLKLATERQRPTDRGGRGRFWHSNSPLNSSFPSAHAMLTWSAASVLAHEYPSRLTAVVAYGLAGTVSAARVASGDHFASDVFAGSALGWFIGRQVYAAHHDAQLPGGGWGTFHRDGPSESWSTASRFSPYLPLESWVYPAFDRLISFAVIRSGFQGMRPWTRRECARLLEETDEATLDASRNEASGLLSALKQEFVSELTGSDINYAGIDSVYARATSISGPPLTDGYHFNKTIPYDYGRPYERGTNGLAGFSSSGSAGAVGFYLRGEYEHAPFASGVSQAVQDQIQIADSKPVVQPATAIQAFNRLRLIEAYVSLNVRDWQASFGKQSLWTGPTRDPFMFSNNAEPLYMFRVDQTSPRKLPGLLERLGPYRMEFFFGQITGHHYFISDDGRSFVSIGRTLARQPMMHSEKISFKPTENFEFGVSRTVMWGGPGIPITLGELRRTLFTVNNPKGASASALDPGDQNSYFNWSYRVPGLRKWLTIYEDSFSEDEISPIGYPRLSAHNPGIYLTQLPKLHRLDFRIEGGYTDLPGFNQPPGGGFFYWNIGYTDGHTNKGNIMGSTIGRQGISFRAATTYWVAPNKTIQLSYRNMEANKQFLHGGNLRDVQVHSQWSFRPDVSLTSLLQYEQWNYPLLSLGKKQTNFTASFQLTYEPKWRWHGGQ